MRLREIAVAGDGVCTETSDDFAGCLRSTTRIYLPGSHSPTIITHYPLPTTHYPLLTTHYSLLTTQYPITNTQYPLLTTHYSLLTTRCHRVPGPPLPRRRVAHHPTGRLTSLCKVPRDARGTCICVRCSPPTMGLSP